MEKIEKAKESIRDVKVEELKEFINGIQKSQKKEKAFKPERLQNMREGNFSRKYSSGFSN